MRIALLMDESRLRQEHPTLNRLCVGLLGEGVRIIRVVPATMAVHALDSAEKRIGLVPRLEASLKVPPWMRRERTARLVDAMERDPPDLLYAMGQQTWPLARDLAVAMDRPLALEINAAEQIRTVPRGRRGLAVAAYLPVTEPLGRSLGRRVDPGLIYVVPMGVALPPEPRQILAQPAESISLAVVGTGRDVPAYQGLLSGLSRVIHDFPQIHVFLELRGPNEHEIWRHARKLDLLERMSAITDSALHRGLLTRCDVLLRPERYGELRSLLLDAMAFGMAIVSNADPFLDMLVDGETAAIVADADPEQWAQQLRRLLKDPEAGRALGTAARERIAAEHQSSDQVHQLVHAFERIVTGGVYRLEA